MSTPEPTAAPAPQKPGRPVLWQFLALVLCAGGLALSLHLLHRGLILKNSTLPETIDPCRKVFNVGCDDTLRSERSEIFGVPIAGWGVIYFAGMSSLLILSLAQGEAFRREAMAAGLLLATCGAVGSIGLASLMVLGKAPVCPACLAVHTLCLGLVPLCRLTYGGTLREWLADLRAGVRYLGGARTERPTETTWKMVGFVNVALVIAMAFVWVDAAERAGTSSDTDSAARRQQFDAKRVALLADYAKVARIEVPVRFDDPRIGSENAPCQFVVFSTFACDGCQRVARALENLRREFPEDVDLVHKYQTYGTEVCPPDQPESEATESCRANWAAEAARRQGKFWEYHDALFRSGTDCTEQNILAAANVAGLDLARFDEDRRSNDVRSRVADHLADGKSLGIVATPTVFLNGRQVPELGLNQFRWLVEAILDAPDQPDVPASSPSAPQSIDKTGLRPRP